MARPDLSDRDAALALWRHSQRHAEAEADWSAWAAAWTWLTTPDVEQRVICTATHFHAGRCPLAPPDPRHRCAVRPCPHWRIEPGHRCHRGHCPARHRHRKGTA